MSREIIIDPVTRIEGHASVILEVDDANRISSSLFRVMDFRGFETFLQGMQVEAMPAITARICGTCPQTHNLAASRTADKVFGADVPRAAELLRNILNLSALIASHAVHFFALAGPDLIMGLSSDPAQRNIVGMAKKHPDVSKQALRLRTIGQKIVELIAGRGTHSVGSVAGGMAVVLDKDAGQEVRRLVAEANELGPKLYGVAKTLLTKHEGLIQSLPLKTNYLGTTKKGALDFYDGDLRLCDDSGQTYDFQEDQWTSYLFEKAEDDSYAKLVYATVNGEAAPYRVGPLARLNCADTIDTPLAQAELEEFRTMGGRPCHQTVMYHLARMIELLHAVEKLNQLVNDDEIFSDAIKAPLGSPQNATAHVEAPRGVLIHDYEVDANAIVTKANLLVATQQNLSAINETIGLSAQQYLDQPDETLLNAVEFGIRCYDPCLSCATHRIGEMKLQVTVCQNEKTIRRIRR